MAKTKKLNARIMAKNSDKLIRANANNTLDTRKSASLALGDVGKEFKRRNK